MAMFSKRHYQLTASVLRHEYAASGDNSSEQAMVFVIGDALADELARDNPAFHKGHFLDVIKGLRAVNSSPRGDHGD